MLLLLLLLQLVLENVNLILLLRQSFVHCSEMFAHHAQLSVVATSRRLQLILAHATHLLAFHRHTHIHTPIQPHGPCEDVSAGCCPEYHDASGAKFSYGQMPSLMPTNVINRWISRRIPDCSEVVISEHSSELRSRKFIEIQVKK